MMTEKKKWLIGLGILGLFFVLGVSLMVFMGAKKPGKQTVGARPFGEPQVGLVRVEDAILFSEPVVEQIEALRTNKKIKAMLLRIDSPGGGVAPSQEIYEAVQAFRAEGKKVIVSMGSVAASGGYYVACPADTIVANPGTLTGSIGVIFSFPYFESLLKKIGVDLEVVKSGKFKDAGSPHRPLTAEERALFQGVINDTWDQFVEAVADGRGLDTAYVRGLADGRIFTGRQALELGLVDTLGSFEEAKLIAKKMAGVSEDSEIFEFSQAHSLLEYVFGQKLDGLLQLKEKALPSGVSYLFSR